MLLALQPDSNLTMHLAKTRRSGLKAFFGAFTETQRSWGEYDCKRIDLLVGGIESCLIVYNPPLSQQPLEV